MTIKFIDYLSSLFFMRAVSNISASDPTKPHPIASINIQTYRMSENPAKEYIRTQVTCSLSECTRLFFFFKSIFRYRLEAMKKPSDGWTYSVKSVSFLYEVDNLCRFDCQLNTGYFSIGNAVALIKSHNFAKQNKKEVLLSFAN